MLRARRQLADAPRRLVAADARQADVEHRQVGDRRPRLRAPRPGRRGPPPCCSRAARTSSPGCWRCRRCRRPPAPGFRRAARRRPGSLARTGRCRRRRRWSARGSLKREPRFSPSLSARTLPPCISTSFFTSARPMPSPPPCERSRPRSTWANMSNTRGSIAAGMPRPESSTVTTAWPASRQAPRTIRPPSGVYFAALLSRLAITCTSRVESARTISDSAGGRRSAQLLTPRLDQRPAGLDRVLQHRQHVDPVRPELDLALGDAADVEQVVDQMDHLTELAFDDVASAVDGLRLARQGHDLERIADRRERIAQLVGEGGEEFVLAAVGAAQRLLHRLAAGGIDDRAEHAGRRGAVAVDRAVHLDPVDASVGPDHAALEMPVAQGLERVLEACLDDLPVLGMDVGEEDLRVPFLHGLAVAEALVVAQRVAHFEGGEVEIPVADAGRVEHEAQVSAALAQRRLDPLAVGHVADDGEIADRPAARVVQPADGGLGVDLRARMRQLQRVAAAHAALVELLGRLLPLFGSRPSAPRTGRSRSGRVPPRSSCRSAPPPPDSDRSRGRHRRRRRPHPPSAPARPCAAGSSWRRRSPGCRSGCRRRAHRPRRCGSPRASPRLPGAARAAQRFPPAGALPRSRRSPPRDRSAAAAARCATCRRSRAARAREASSPASARR